MKKYMIALACLFSAMTGFAQDALTIENAIIAPGETGELNVILTNPQMGYIACQFDLTLPEGLDVLRKANGDVSKKAVVLTNRSYDEKEEISYETNLVQVEGENHFRFTMYHNPSQVFLGNSGDPIVKIGVKASENFAGGEGQIFAITITNENRVGFNPDDATFAVNTPTPYYLTGTMTSWSSDLTDEYMLVRNGAAEGVEEYMISIDLEPGTQLKVVQRTDNDLVYYPAGMGNAYGEVGGTEITEAANYTVYFRPNKDGAEDWYEGYLFVTKSIVDGINTLSFNKSAVIYNMKGQRVMNAQKGLYIQNGKKVVIK
jgi:hypothetical protein